MEVKTTKAQMEWEQHKQKFIYIQQEGKKKEYVKSQCKFLLIDTNEAKWEKMEHAEREGGRTKLYMQAMV